MIAVVGCTTEPEVVFTRDAGSDAAVGVDSEVITDSSAVTDRGGVTDRGAVTDRGGVTDVPPLLDNVRVYAHTAAELFAVNPATFAVQRVGDFGWPQDGRQHQMTDIAVNADGWMWGITFDSLYRVNPMDARCVFIAPFDGAVFNGLSFIPGGELESGEVLVAANREGRYFRVDTRTGALSMLGTYGDGVQSSGDIVSVRNGGTFATVVRDGDEYLARIDPMTGRATVIGPTGISETWGLGYWRSQVFGFSNSGGFYTLDLETGRATLVTNTGASWWGAGVTTLAPTAPP